jgi:hypothetical protein
MNTTRLTQARRLFTNRTSPRHVQRHNIRQWVRAMRVLHRTERAWA